MLKIAICDDDEIQNEILEEMLYDYNSVSTYRVDVSAFDCGEALLKTQETNGNFDIYILDVVMPVMDGLELAKRIRKSDDTGKIVFLSAETSFVYKAFAVSASGYLVKPVDPEELFELVNSLRTQIEKERPSFILINSDSGSRRVEVRDIMYVDTIERTPVYHLADGKKVSGRSRRVKFQEMVAELLNGHSFALSSVGVAVNLSNVESVKSESNEIRLKNGEVLLCSRTMKDNFLRRLADFWNM